MCGAWRAGERENGLVDNCAERLAATPTQAIIWAHARSKCSHSAVCPCSWSGPISQCLPTHPERWPSNKACRMIALDRALDLYFRLACIILDLLMPNWAWSNKCRWFGAIKSKCSFRIIVSVLNSLCGLISEIFSYWNAYKTESCLNSSKHLNWRHSFWSSFFYSTHYAGRLRNRSCMLRPLKVSVFFKLSEKFKPISHFCMRSGKRRLKNSGATNY